jgi:hypothetical protein
MCRCFAWPGTWEKNSYEVQRIDFMEIAFCCTKSLVAMRIRLFFFFFHREHVSIRYNARG